MTADAERFRWKGRRMNSTQYRRVQRAKRFLCTKCGKEIESRDFMMCHKCREKAREYMRKKRSKPANFSEKNAPT